MHIFRIGDLGDGQLITILSLFRSYSIILELIFINCLLGLKILKEIMYENIII